MTDESKLRKFVVCARLGNGQAVWTNIKAEKVIVSNAALQFKVGSETVAEVPGRHVVLWAEEKYRS